MAESAAPTESKPTTGTCRFCKEPILKDGTIQIDYGRHVHPVCKEKERENELALLNALPDDAFKDETQATKEVDDLILSDIDAYEYNLEDDWEEEIKKVKPGPPPFPSMNTVPEFQAHPDEKWKKVWPNQEGGQRVDMSQQNPNLVNCQLPKFPGPCEGCPSNGSQCWEWGVIDGQYFKYDNCRVRIEAEKVKQDEQSSNEHGESI